MKTKVFCFYIWAVVGLPVAPAFGQRNSFQLSLASQQLIKTGREVYVRNCSGCHGMGAGGDGPAAKMLHPKPRNLLSGSFKFRSTPTGTLPTIHDILRTIDQGVYKSSMPSFRLMSTQEKLAVASYIMGLRADWSQLQGEALFIPQAPSAIFAKKDTLLASAARGHKTYMQACQTCHGDQGLGDGPGAEGLVDAEDQAIKPANLQYKNIKSGRSARDAYKAISTGLDGTPMPGFAEAFTEAQRWDLVAFVFYLRGVGNGSYDAALLKEWNSKK